MKRFLTRQFSQRSADSPRLQATLTLAILLCHPEGLAKYHSVTGKQGFHVDVYNNLLHEAICETTESLGGCPVSNPLQAPGH